VIAEKPVPVVPESILAPIRQEFLALLPCREVSHPLGCHRPRISDAVVFDRLVLALVSGMGYDPPTTGRGSRPVSLVT
jgi:hypothetical protein